MRTIVHALLAAGAVALIAAAPPVSRAIDPGRSTATFSVQHIFVSNVVGSVPIVDGRVTLAPGTRVPTSVTATLDPSGIATGDRDRDAALRGEDWFDVARYPHWTFASTTILRTAMGFTMDGMLTIHGVSRPERLEVSVAGNAEHPIYHATGKIDRHAFGMHVVRLDPVIGNPVTIALDIVLAPPGT